MKNLIICFILLLFISANAQLGCTDLNANNFNISASQNNGSCTYNTSFQLTTEVGSLFPAAPESSGIIYDNGYIYTHNDSGNPSKIYKIDANNGDLIQTINITNFPNDDWEEITADNDFIYIADTGNNLGTRTNLRILKISKSQFINNISTSVDVSAEAINFSYADQTSFPSNQLNNFDCESMISLGNFLYLFTKNRGNGQTKVYKLSKIPATYSLSIHSSYNVGGLLTGATINATNNEIALVGYMPPNAINSFIYYLNDFTSDQFFSGNVRRVEIGSSANAWQTEGICYKNANELFLSCEITNFSNAKLFLTNKNSITLGNNTFINNNDVLKIYPNPSNDNFNFTNTEMMKSIDVLTFDGKTIFKKNVNCNEFSLSKNDFTEISGSYLIKIKTDKETIIRKIIVK